MNLARMGCPDRTDALEPEGRASPTQAMLFAAPRASRRPYQNARTPLHGVGEYVVVQVVADDVNELAGAGLWTPRRRLEKPATPPPRHRDHVTSPRYDDLAGVMKGMKPITGERREETRRR